MIGIIYLFVKNESKYGATSLTKYCQEILACTNMENKCYCIIQLNDTGLLYKTPNYIFLR